MQIKAIVVETQDLSCGDIVRSSICDEKSFGKVLSKDSLRKGHMRILWHSYHGICPEPINTLIKLKGAKRAEHDKTRDRQYRSASNLGS